MATDCAHQASDNPRYTNTCGKCGQILVSTAPSVQRDATYEDRFLREAAERSEKRFGVPTGGFESGVKRRLTMGQEIYQGAYFAMSEDERILMILEEAWDAAAYAVLDTQKRLAAGVDDACAHHLFEIAQHAAAIDSHARALRSGE